MRAAERGVPMLADIRGTIRYKEPLAFHTSLRVGGPADIFVVAETCDDIGAACLFAAQEQLPVFLLGGGSNVLVGDRGIRGLGIKLGAAFTRSEVHGEDVVVGAAATLSSVIRQAAALELGGLEALAGIPGTLGGALATNAGTEDGTILDCAGAAYFVERDGTLGEAKPRTDGSGQRTLDVPPGAVLVGARLHLRHRPRKRIQKDIARHFKAQRAAQPMALASAGFVWKDPAGDSAVRLIAKAGLRGLRVNAAEISAKHPNLIVNRGGAKAADVHALMSMARERVEAKSGIVLEPEIAILGE